MQLAGEYFQQKSGNQPENYKLPPNGINKDWWTDVMVPLKVRMHQDEDRMTGGSLQSKVYIWTSIIRGQ